MFDYLQYLSLMLDWLREFENVSILKKKSRGELARLLRVLIFALPHGVNWFDGKIDCELHCTHEHPMPFILSSQ